MVETDKALYNLTVWQTCLVEQTCQGIESNMLWQS